MRRCCLLIRYATLFRAMLIRLFMLLRHAIGGASRLPLFHVTLSLAILFIALSPWSKMRGAQRRCYMLTRATYA